MNTEELMQEESNHGRARRATDDPNTGDAWHNLDEDSWQAGELIGSGGFGIVDTSRGSGGIESYGAGDAGMTAHRGVLHPDEYVSGLELQRLVEAELGFTYAQIRAVYRQGPLSKEQRQLREQIDARLLALRRSGANLTELGRSIGFEVNASGHVRPFDRAIERARAVEQWQANLQEKEH